MLRRALLATAAACLLSGPALAAGLDTYPVVSPPAAADKVCGYANAAGHATQCSTAASIEAAATPGGSSGAVQYNNGGVLGGISGAIYCAACSGGGPLLDFTNVPVTIQGTSSILALQNGSAVNWLVGSPTTGGGQLFLSPGSVLDFGNGAYLSVNSSTLDVGGTSTAGDHTGLLSLGTLTVGTQISTPDGGSDTATLTDRLVPWRVRGGTGGMTPPLMGAGFGAGYTDGAVHYLNPAHTITGKGGLALQGQTVGGAVDTAGYGFAYQWGLGLYTSTGIAVASVEDQGNWMGIGIQRALSCPAQGDQGCALQGTDYTSQLVMLDLVSGGSYAEPMTVYENGSQVAPLWGLGQAAPNPPNVIVTNASGAGNIFRLGAVGDLNSGWDDRTTYQPDLGLEGGLQLGHSNGSAAAFSGGVGVTWDAVLYSNGGIATLANTGRSATVPISVYFVRPHSGTLAQLNTADPTPAAGDAAFISDATACTFMSTVTGGGSTLCPVHYDSSSSSWKAG